MTALKLFRKIPLASNKNYVMCDGAGAILDVEATTAGPEIIRDEGAGFLAHSNHFVCARYTKREKGDSMMPDSLQALGSNAAADPGGLRLAHGRADEGILSDHSSHPTSICRHPRHREGI